MVYKYGIFQASSKSCVFYKEDEDGNQSTFNIFVKPKEHEADIEKVVAFIDNENFNQENWTKSEVTDVKDVIEAFGGWAADAPIVFELEAHKSLSHCLSTVMKRKEE
jgi:hypothetical protein